MTFAVRLLLVFSILPFLPTLAAAAPVEAQELFGKKVGARAVTFYFHPDGSYQQNSIFTATPKRHVLAAFGRWEQQADGRICFQRESYTLFLKSFDKTPPSQGCLLITRSGRKATCEVSFDGRPVRKLSRCEFSSIEDDHHFFFTKALVAAGAQRIDVPAFLQALEGRSFSADQTHDGPRFRRFTRTAVKLTPDGAGRLQMKGIYGDYKGTAGTVPYTIKGNTICADLGRGPACIEIYKSAETGRYYLMSERTGIVLFGGTISKR